jgi:hypothetical protein
VTLQVTKYAPSVSVDKCEMVRLVLPDPEQVEVEVLTSSTNELNISHLQDDGDFSKDYPVPVQFVTKYNPSKKEYQTKVFSHM